MRVIVFGNGFLGNRIADAFMRVSGPTSSIKSAAHSFVDICSRERVVKAIAFTREARDRLGDHDIVAVNAAGKTGKPNVDWCDRHPAETLRSNVDGAVALASACAELGVHLIHLGSGCIFYGRSPNVVWTIDENDKKGALDIGWRESDLPNPISLYSKTKWSADQALMYMPHVAILRLRMPIDSAPHARNLITKLAGYPSVIDVTNSVTVVDDLIDVVRQVAERRLSGIFHAVNPGAISHREILALYRELVDPGHRTEFIPESTLVARGLAAKPRSNCVLADTRLAAAGIKMRPIQEALRDAMEKYAAAVRGAAAT